MSAIQKYPVLVLRLGGKNVGVPIIKRELATLDDLAEMDDAIWSDIVYIKDRIEYVKDLPVAITTNYVPLQTSGTVNVPPPSIPELKQKDIGRMVIFGGGTAIGIVTGVITTTASETKSTYAYTTVKLLQT